MILATVYGFEIWRIGTGWNARD